MSIENNDKKNIEQHTSNKSLWKNCRVLIQNTNYGLTSNKLLISKLFKLEQIILLIVSLFLIHVLILDSSLYMKVFSLVLLVSSHILLFRKNPETTYSFTFGLVLICISILQLLSLLLIIVLIFHFTNNNNIIQKGIIYVGYFILFFVFPTNISLFIKASTLNEFFIKNYLIFIYRNLFLLITQSFTLVILYLIYLKMIVFFNIDTIYLPTILFLFYLFFYIISYFILILIKS
jgi:hypothetical protein